MAVSARDNNAKWEIFRLVAQLIIDNPKRSTLAAKSMYDVRSGAHSQQLGVSQSFSWSYTTKNNTLKYLLSNLIAR